MKSRIEVLLSKYWEGESSLEEEKELKELLRSSDGFAQEKKYFGVIGDFGKEGPKRVSEPKKRARIATMQWLGWAASLILIVSSVWVWRDYEQKKEEQQAYEEVMQALSMIQSNLEKGQRQMTPLNDLKYLNTTNQLFQQNP